MLSDIILMILLMIWSGSVVQFSQHREEGYITWEEVDIHSI